MTRKHYRRGIGWHMLKLALLIIAGELVVLAIGLWIAVG